MATKLETLLRSHVHCLRKRYDYNSILKLVWEDLMTNDSLQYYVQMFLIMYTKDKDLREHLGTVHCLNTYLNNNLYSHNQKNKSSLKVCSHIWVLFL